MVWFVGTVVVGAIIFWSVDKKLADAMWGALAGALIGMMIAFICSMLVGSLARYEGVTTNYRYKK